MMRSVRSKRVVFSLALVAALLAIMVSVGVAQRGNINGQQDTAQAVQAAQSLSHAFRQAAGMIMPAVVKIKTVTHVKQVGQTQNANPFRGTPLEDYFNDKDLRRFFSQPFSRRRQGMGSGVIIDRSGIILTNNHVVDGADEVVVELEDGREFKTTEIKTDPETDLAVVRISGTGSLPQAKLGDSSKMEIGDWVIAVGHPFDLDETVSAGIISGKGRTLTSGRRSTYLQTDAAINPGNSGGPLVNLDGEVIGINTAIASNSGGYQGIGFAIPTNLAKWVSKQLIESGNVQRAYLGVKIGKITAELAEQFGVQPGDGVLVGDVLPNSPAAKAGFQAGDLITSFAGKRVRQPRELQEIVERSKVNSSQTVEILRDGKKMNLKVVPRAMPSSDTSASNAGGGNALSPSSGDSYSAKSLGIEVASLTPEAAAKLGFKGYDGVVITAVDPGGVAAENQLREGMLIRQVGRTRIKNVQDFEQALKSTSLQKGVMLLLRTSNGNQFFVVLKR